MSTRAIALITASVLVATAARAEHDTTSTVRGTVVDSSGHPMSGVEVYVLTVGRGSRTDDAGRYVVVDLLQGPTRLRARLPGWQPVDTAITIGPRTSAIEAIKPVYHPPSGREPRS